MFPDAKVLTDCTVRTLDTTLYDVVTALSTSRSRLYEDSETAVVLGNVAVVRQQLQNAIVDFHGRFDVKSCANLRLTLEIPLGASHCALRKLSGRTIGVPPRLRRSHLGQQSSHPTVPLDFPRTDSMGYSWRAEGFWR
jgi:hypothetical protein